LIVGDFPFLYLKVNCASGISQYFLQQHKQLLADAGAHYAQCHMGCVIMLGSQFRKGLIDVAGNSMDAEFAQDDYEKPLVHLQKICSAYPSEALEFLWLSDTFVIFTPDDTAHSYAVIEQGARNFIEACLYSCIPIRGAISCGALIRRNDSHALMGHAFLDAYEYGEDQDWLGLLLTPSAIKKVRSLDLEPTRHDFISSDEIPMRKFSCNEVLAYRLQKGADSSIAPLLSCMESMKRCAQPEHHLKYERTIEFIKKHARYAQ